MMSKRTTDVVAYLSWIGLLVAFVAGDRSASRFHLNQSLVIWLSGTVAGLVGRVPRLAPAGGLGGGPGSGSGAGAVRGLLVHRHHQRHLRRGGAAGPPSGPFAVDLILYPPAIGMILGRPLSVRRDAPFMLTGRLPPHIDFNRAPAQSWKEGTTIMKKMALSFVKCITFFVGWAVAASLLPLPRPRPPRSGDCGLSSSLL